MSRSTQSQPFVRYYMNPASKDTRADPAREPLLNMEKMSYHQVGTNEQPRTRSSKSTLALLLGSVVLFSLAIFHNLPRRAWNACFGVHGQSAVLSSDYGVFPKPSDPFQFIPCTNTSVTPSLDDDNPQKSWSKLFDSDPSHWSWGHATANGRSDDPYDGRGIYLCGYLDVPMDYLNETETRIVRLALTKFQVSGLSRIYGNSQLSSGEKSERTLLINPGGPGGSGTSYTWRKGEEVTQRFASGAFDVLGWDPRGVNMSLPAVSCFPYDVDRDHWSLLTTQFRPVSASPMAQLEVADAMNEAVFRACYEIHGDFLRFISTASVARDVDRIRQVLGEDKLSGYFVSYGTAIGQTYVNMFPDNVGRLILDGNEYIRDNRVLGGWGWPSLDNVTDAWHDGFLGECLNAGPEHCALAKPVSDEVVTLEGLQNRIEKLIFDLVKRPVPAYTDFSGPSIITYTRLVNTIATCMYDATTWPDLALMLSDLEAGNSTTTANFLERSGWEYDPTLPSPFQKKPSTDELAYGVVCADMADLEEPEEGMEWWDSLWKNMTDTAWIGSDGWFDLMFSCRHYNDFWEPNEIFRGDLNHTLSNPVLLIAETHNPATPLRNAKELLAEMGKNARLIVHHGYGHSSRDRSNCTDSTARKYIMEGIAPEHQETDCFADEKPYLYGVNKR